MPVTYEKEPTETCCNCGKEQFVKRNQVREEKIGNAVRRWLQCKYCHYLTPVSKDIIEPSARQGLKNG